MHAQLAAIGGAVLYELQVLSYYLAHFVVDREQLRELKPPTVPEPEALDPGRPRDPLAEKPRKRRPIRREREECEFTSPAVAAAMLRAIVRS